jgi:hypothetical protein
MKGGTRKHIAVHEKTRETLITVPHGSWYVRVKFEGERNVK